MFGKELLWSSSGKGVVLRVLSCETDGSIMYSWKNNDCTDCKSLTFIRHFDPINNDDKVLLVCRGTAEIVHASLSIDKNAIAFTIWFQPERLSATEKLFEVVTDITKYTISEIEDHRPFVSNDFSTASSESLDQNIIPNSDIGSSPQPIPHHRGVYRSYVAQTYPTRWFMKFTGHKLAPEDKRKRKPHSPDEKLLQKPIFTNYFDKRVVGDIKLLQYDILLITHKHSIGLYSVLLEQDSASASRLNMKVSNDNLSQIADSRRCGVYGKPHSEVLVEKVVWSQWDELSQRLYYVVPTQASKEGGNKASRLFRIVGLQFFQDSPREQVFDVEVDLDISAHASRNVSCASRELDPTVSSRDLNMRLCFFHETGSLCLCWQELPCLDVTPQWAYSIALLDKDIILRHRYQKGDSMAAMSFTVVGENLVVHSPGSYVHVYDVESINCDDEQMSNGLYHMFLDESNFRHLVNTSVEYMMSRQYFDAVCESRSRSSSIDSSLSTASSLTLAIRHQSVVCFDRNSKAFFSFDVDAEDFTKLYFDKSLSIQNKIFLTRQAVWLTKGKDSPNRCLLEVYRNIQTDPTDKNVTAVIAQLLIALTYVELLDPKYRVPSLLMPLFPTTLPTSSLNKLISSTEQSSGGLSFGYLETRLKLKSQIEQFVSSSVTRQKQTNFKRFSSPHENHDRFHVNSHERMSFSWLRSLHACETGSFTEYNLESIRVESTLLEGSYAHPGLIPSEKFFDQSFGLFRDRLLKKLGSSRNEVEPRNDSSDATSSDDSLVKSLNECPRTWLAFLDESERTAKSEIVLLLTYTNLCDHLLAHRNNKVDKKMDEELKEMARNYVHAQVHTAHHTLTSILMAYNVDNLNFDRPLYSRSTSTEQDLLFALNQFQLVCEITCFPLPNGFHTLITCLTFRSLLARYAYSEGNNVFSEESLHLFSECLFDYVDRKLLQLTDGFVNRMLRELGDKQLFGPVIEEVLKRTRSFDDEDPMKIEGLLQWRNVKAMTHACRAELKEIYERQEAHSPPQDDDSRGRSVSMIQTEEQSVPSFLKEVKNAAELRPRSHSVVSQSSNSGQSSIGFPPLDIFLDFVKKFETDILKINSSQNGKKHNTSDLIESSVLKQAG